MKYERKVNYNEDESKLLSLMNQYEKERNYSEAIKIYEAIFLIKQEYNDLFGESFYIARIGFAYSCLGENIIAFEYYE